MDSRIDIIMNDRSERIDAVIGTIGATVIKCNRGGNAPILFARKSEYRIIETFGKPGPGNEHVWDILEYNKNYPIWVSAPSKNGRFGGVLISDTGITSLPAGLLSNTSIDFSSIEVEHTVGFGDGTQILYSVTLPSALFTNYIPGSIDIRVDNNSTNVSATTADPEILTTTPDVGSGTLTKSTRVLEFTFTTPPAAGQKITCTYRLNLSSSNNYMLLVNKYPQADDLQITAINSNVNNSIDITLRKPNILTGEMTNTADSPYTASIDPEQKNGFGQYVYAEKVFEENDYIVCKVNPNAVWSGFTDVNTPVNFSGGLRGTTDDTDVINAYNQFKDKNKYPVSIFFDLTASSGVALKFDELRKNHQKYSTYLLATPNATKQNIITHRTTTNVSNRGVKYYAGWAEVINTYGPINFVSPLLGRIASNHADMHVVYNALQVADINENNLGGQIGGGVVRMLQNFSENDIIDLESNQVNPIIMHPYFGLMVVRDRTSLKGPTSDYSFGGHSRLADYIIENAVSVLEYQKSKPNDFEHRMLVKNRIEAILSPLLIPPRNYLREGVVICDETNNTNNVMARNEFVVEVIIKFTPFSNRIKFYFTNLNQTTSVQEYLGG